MSDPSDVPATATCDARAWVGREEEAHDIVSAGPARALAATLDHGPRDWQAGDALPPLWHWLYFLPLHRASELGADGHAQLGGFLPQVDLPRRMWAGGRFEFSGPLRIGAPVRRVSRIEDVARKSGCSGALLFVRVRHEITQRVGEDWRPALSEEHDIVYRAAPRAGETAPPSQPAPGDAAFERRVEPSAVLLFRYSALTFNGHRIHYDRRFCSEEEGYPGLVVHGPLLATLLVDLLLGQAPARPLKRFAFRALRPLFDPAPFALCGRLADDASGARLWVRDQVGALTLDATAVFE